MINGVASRPRSPSPRLHGERVGVRGGYKCRRTRLPLTLTLSPF